MSDTLDLAVDLVRRASITPDDAGCQTLIMSRLEALGFDTEPMRFGDVDNFWARRGSSRPVLCFAGHTDVVPTGPPGAWLHEPFSATIADGHLYGRGAADMKGSLAAMVTATERFVADHPDHKGSIAYLITSDEEGAAVDGTIKVVNALQARNEKIDWALVGEPSSEERLGDVVKNGRRGSLGGRLLIQGVQGHVAYPHRAKNPVHEALPALAQLAKEQWDQGNEHFPPTTFQISNINAGTGATNVIPGTLEVMFNFRYSIATDHHELSSRVAAILGDFGLDYELRWAHSGLPFLTPHGELVEATKAAIATETGHQTRLSTAGGTSDGRFLAPTGAQVIELGPINATIHKVNERVQVTDLDGLSRIYESVLVRLLTAT